MNRVTHFSARYDNKSTAAYRGWVIDVIFENGYEMTIPAAPHVFYTSSKSNKKDVEDATMRWMSAHKRNRTPSGLHVAISAARAEVEAVSA